MVRPEGLGWVTICGRSLNETTRTVDVGNGETRTWAVWNFC